jgi:hypothetical protein
MVCVNPPIQCSLMFPCKVSRSNLIRSKESERARELICTCSQLRLSAGS